MRSAIAEFACLFFDADDCVCVADVVDAPIKRIAIKRATELMQARPGVVGFQVWSVGAKVAEHFIPLSERSDNSAEPASITQSGAA